MECGANKDHFEWEGFSHDGELVSKKVLGDYRILVALSMHDMIYYSQMTVACAQHCVSVCVCVAVIFIAIFSLTYFFFVLLILL